MTVKLGDDAGVQMFWRTDHVAGAIALALAASVIPLAHAAQAGSDVQLKTRQTVKLQAGDVLVHRDDEGWSTVLILAVDVLPGGWETAHCLIYRAVPDKPAMAALPGLGVLTFHAPIRASSFGDWEHIGAKAPTKAETAGFVEYLKLTDFRRYVDLTGQKLERVIEKANRAYNLAIRLDDEGHPREAIAKYSEAMDIFPLFYEAIDNRAFIYMDLGDYGSALSDFDRSLRVNPDGEAAFFSKGECLMKLGRLDEAEAIFTEGQTRFPAKASLFTEFLGRVRALRSGPH